MSESTDNNVPGAVKEALNIFRNGWKKQLVLYGPPGTSKTYSATIIAAKFLAEKTEGSSFNLNELSDYEKAQSYLRKKTDQFRIVQFHPSYSYEDFVRGIKVEPGSDGKTINYVVEPKIIEEFSKNCSKDNPKVLIIDEINRAPLATVLGELIYGLENRDQPVTSPYELKSKEPLRIPNDLYIIGTMNTADRSIGSMDYAVRRRFAFIAVPSSPEAIKKTWINSTAKDLAYTLYNNLVSKDAKEGIFRDDLIADPEMDVEDIRIGHTYFLGKDNQDLNYLVYRIIYEIWPIYNEYIKDGLINNDDNKAKRAFAKAVANSFGDKKTSELIEFLENTLEYKPE